jgi:NTE family protein
MGSTVPGAQASRRLGRHAPKIVYVLSGGAAKGFCHLGMIEALEGRGVKPDLVVGTSAGALFGALYCCFGAAAGVSGRVQEVLASREFASFEKKYLGAQKQAEGDVDSRLRRFLSSLQGKMRNGVHLGRAMVGSAMIARDDAEEIFARIFEGITVDSLAIPFGAVAVDLVDGVPVTFASRGAGDARAGATPIAGADGLARAVMASSAIPFVFPAVELGGHAHADGYIMANLPVREARALLPGEDVFAIGLDVSAPLAQADEDLSAVELALRLLSLATRAKQDADRDLVDVLLQPVDRAFAWSSFSAWRELVEMGRSYMTEERLDSLEAAYADACRSRAREGTPLARVLTALGRGRRISPRSASGRG